METLAWPWACDPGGGQREPPAAWETRFVTDGSPPPPPAPPAAPPAALMWMEQLSPHLQRNKQLQDALLQREEELARLQEENSALREFLTSSYVRSLERKAKKLAAARRPKRTLSALDPPVCRPPQVSKRHCRNLAAELASAASVPEPNLDPNLDLWVLRTLGLKDRDTIDTSGCPARYAAPSSPPPYALTSPFGSPVSMATPQPACGFTATAPDGAAPSGDLAATAMTSPSAAAPPARHLDSAGYWSPLRDSVLFGPLAETLGSSPLPSSTPNRPSAPAGRRGPTSSPAASQPPDAAPTPRCRTDLAFSMSLSPSNSVRTHSFPQGQAFTRKDTEGRWNFTWVPKQGP